MATAKAFKAPSAPRLPASVKADIPSQAMLKAAAKKMLTLKVRENDIKAARLEPTALLVANCQGDTFTFPEGKVRVSKDTPSKPTDFYGIEFDQDAWDALQDDAEKAALQEQLIKLGVVKLFRKVTKATPSRVSVCLAGEKED
jgi:hypothetical protein